MGAFFIFGLGCATLPRNYSTAHEGQWRGKVLIHDKRSDHSGILNITVKAIKGERLRIDMTSPLGTYLGSISIVGRELDYLSVNDRTLYRMRANRHALQAILKVPISSNIIYSILFDNEPAGPDWSCQDDSHGFLKSCFNGRENLKALWLSRHGDSRVVEIDHRIAQVQMDLYDFKPQIENPKMAFILRVPHSFKIKNLIHSQTSRSETYGRN